MKGQSVKKLSRGQSTEEYNPRDYWTRVARQIKQRSNDNIRPFDDSPFNRYKRDIFLIKFLDQLPVQGKAVLEVGCGSGANLTRIAKAQPRKLVGCDVSEEMIELAQKNIRALEEVDIILTDGISLPFPDRSFDLTFTSTVLQHNHDTMLAKLLPEICRVTADELYLIEDTGQFKLERFSSFIFRPVGEYAKLCASEGFDLIAADPIELSISSGLHYALHAAFRLLNHQEGAPIPKAYDLLERVGLSITKPLDNVIKQRWGLTRMTFRRRKL
jgi:SAM-dependent methyltransferase